MVVLKKFDEIYEIIRERKSVQVDLHDLNDLDYLRIIDLIRCVRQKITRVGRFTYSFNCE